MAKMKNWLLYKILKEIKNSSLHIIIYATRIIVRIYAIAKEHYYDKRLGIDTSGYYMLRDSLSLYKDGYVYQPTPYWLLEKVFDYLKLKPDDVFVDFGSGKGRVISFVAQQRIKRVIGIELHKELTDIAKINLDNLKSRNTPVEIINTDAATFDAKEGTMFFMFNPFGEKTVARVIENIKDTLAANPRKIRIVYGRPAFSHRLDSQDWLVPEGEIENTGALAWHNRPKNSTINS
jgi:16S rRNA G966 N2-methylase RsmD